MRATRVDKPLHLTWCQLKSVPRPWMLVILLLLLVPWFGLVAAAGDTATKLTSFIVLYLLLSTHTSGDRRLWRALSMNRTAAMRQQLIISAPLLILAAVFTLRGMPGTAWFPAAVLGVVAVVIDVLITTTVKTSGSGGSWTTGELGLAGPASRGGVSTRLLWIPMLRWSLPCGLLLGVVLASGMEPGESLLGSFALGGSLVLAALVPVLEILSGTASLATWQTLGLPRRAWSKVTAAAALLAPVLTLSVALLACSIAAVWGAVAWDEVHDFRVAALSLAPLWMGMAFLLVAVAGQNAIFGSPAVGAIGYLVGFFSINVLQDGSPRAAVIGGALLFGLGLYLQWRIIHNTGDRRASSDTRKFAK